jgi:adenylate cyclase
VRITAGCSRPPATASWRRSPAPCRHCAAPSPVQERLRSAPDGLRLRIGVHQGEVVAEGDDLLGDGVIIAARLEPLAEPGGICISARVREDATGKMALEVDDLGTPELKNIAAKVQVFRVRLSTAERLALRLPDKPSLVVLPFQNMSGDPEQEYFADGMVEEITTALSRIRSLFVIARNSAFTYKGRAVVFRRGTVTPIGFQK